MTRINNNISSNHFSHNNSRCHNNISSCNSNSFSSNHNSFLWCNLKITSINITFNSSFNIQGFNCNILWHILNRCIRIHIKWTIIIIICIDNLTSTTVIINKALLEVLNNIAFKIPTGEWALVFLFIFPLTVVDLNNTYPFKRNNGWQCRQAQYEQQYAIRITKCVVDAYVERTSLKWTILT